MSLCKKGTANASALLARGAHPRDNIVNILHLKAIGQRNHRNSLGGYTHSAATHAASGVDVAAGCVRSLIGSLVGVVKTVFAFATAILETMQQSVLFKGDKGAENRAAVYGVEEQV